MHGRFCTIFRINNLDQRRFYGFCPIFRTKTTLRVPSCRFLYDFYDKNAYINSFCHSYIRLLGQKSDLIILRKSPCLHVLCTAMRATFATAGRLRYCK